MLGITPLAREPNPSSESRTIYIAKESVTVYYYISMSMEIDKMEEFPRAQYANIHHGCGGFMKYM
jgi:hypothetical protein